jgi:hypothetical protein
VCQYSEGLYQRETHDHLLTASPYYLWTLVMMTEAVIMVASLISLDASIYLS